MGREALKLFQFPYLSLEYFISLFLWIPFETPHLHHIWLREVRLVLVTCDPNWLMSAGDIECVLPVLQRATDGHVVKHGQMLNELTQTNSTSMRTHRNWAKKMKGGRRTKQREELGSVRHNNQNKSTTSCCTKQTGNGDGTPMKLTRPWNLFIIKMKPLWLATLCGYTALQDALCKIYITVCHSSTWTTYCSHQASLCKCPHAHTCCTNDPFLINLFV